MNSRFLFCNAELNCWKDTAHHETGGPRIKAAKKRPKAAGLKTWRFPNLIKFFENIAKAAIATGIYQLAKGDVKSPIILPLTSPALGKNGLIPLIFRNKRSKISADPIDNIKTSTAFNDGLLKKAVIKIRVRRNPIWVLGVFSLRANHSAML